MRIFGFLGHRSYRPRLSSFRRCRSDRRVRECCMACVRGPLSADDPATPLKGEAGDLAPWQKRNLVVPAESAVYQQAGGHRTRRAARAQPAVRMAAGGAGQHIDTSDNIGLFRIARQIRRQRALTPAMRRHDMAAHRDRCRQVRVAFRHHAAGIEDGPHAFAVQQIEQPPGAGLRSVLRPGQCLQIGHAGLQRVAHRADAGRAALGPALKHDADRDRERLPRRPAGWHRRIDDRHKMASAARFLDRFLREV